jgi:hypothetical protein
MNHDDRMAELNRLARDTGQERSILLREKVGVFSSGAWGSLHENEIRRLEHAIASTPEPSEPQLSEPDTTDVFVQRRMAERAARQADDRARADARLAADAAAITAQQTARETHARDLARYYELRRADPFAAASFADAHPHIHEPPPAAIVAPPAPPDPSAERERAFLRSAVYGQKLK